MRTFEEARALIVEAARKTPTALERVSCDEALGRVLGEDVVLAGDMPAFDNSAMDGWAVRAADLAGDPPHTLRVAAGESRAGGDARGSLLRVGECVRIFTGAPVPAGADAVVMQEYAAREGDVLRVEKLTRPGQHIRHAGSDARAGSVVLRAGVRVGPTQVAGLYAADRARVTVRRAPVVTVLSTGDELREPGEEARFGSVVDCNGPGLRAMALRAGATVRVAPRVGDGLEATREAVRAALAGSDVVLTVGGVSVGDHDLVRAALALEGVALEFWRVAIKPGKPLAYGRGPAGQHVLGLPGNPASAMVTFALFGVPMLRALAGDARVLPRVLRGRLAHDARHHTGRVEFARASVAYDERDGTAWVTVAEGTGQSSGNVLALAASDGVALLEADTERYPRGSDVRVLCWEDA